MLSRERLQKLRRNSKMTQADIAKEIGIERTTYGRYETGDIQPPTDMIVLIAKYFNVSTDYLLGVSDEPELFSIHNDLNPQTGKKMSGLEKKQLEEVLENAQALFFDEEISERDKETFLRSINDSFWEAKEMNRHNN